MVTKMKEEEIKTIDTGNIKARMEGQKADRDYLHTNYDDLLNRYRNRWIVISGGKLIKVEEDPDRLIKTLSKLQKEDMLVYYLSDPKELLIL